MSEVSLSIFSETRSFLRSGSEILSASAFDFLSSNSMERDRFLDLISMNSILSPLFVKETVGLSESSSSRVIRTGSWEDIWNLKALRSLSNFGIGSGDTER
jgi:hypothetical protein